MDKVLDQLLVTGIRKKAILEILGSVDQKSALIAPLLNEIRSDNKVRRRKAVWVFRNLVLSPKIQLNSSHFMEITEILRTERDSSIIRDLLKIMIDLPAPEESTGQLTDICFKLLSQGKYAVKYYSLNFLEKQCKDWPELKDELIDAATSQQDLYTKSFKHHVSKMLKRFGKS
ncbi:MAG: hypothetical protein HKN32_07135 [Flavobacteriales bacterium]|nr:hypothetical protein [Flavobacteriales bacterium]